MTWLDRLRQAAYTSPGGVRKEFLYEDVSLTVDKKTAAYDFPDANGTYVQDLGHSGRKYPLQVIFSGANYDIDANEFESLLLEQGIGKLEHPIYGVIQVTPFGTIERRDNLTSAANQTFINVVFWETIDLVFPESQTDPGAQVLNSVNEFNAANAEQFQSQTNLGSVVEQASIIGTVKRSLDSVKQGLQKIANFQNDVSRQFNTIYNSINSNINALVGQPLTLAFQTAQLIQAPARALTSISERLEAYGDLANRIIGGGVEETANKFHVQDTYIQSHITGYIASVVNTQFRTKSEALQAADTLLSLYTDVTTWQQLNYSSLGIIDIGQAYQQLQEAVAIAAGFLVQISFTLEQEKIIILDRARSIIDLVYELYQELDNKLDFFIETNNLSGSEILELPKGKRIVYYV